MNEVSATEPDWSRERPRRAWDPGRQMLRALRDYQKGGQKGGPLRRLAVLRHRFWSAVAGCDVPISSRIGGGLLLPHPTGVVVHPDAVIGPNYLLMQNTTIGGNCGGAVPRLGGHVDVGPGAQVLGGVTIGDHAVIGANAVVPSDGPPGRVAVGVPARLLPPEAGGAPAARAQADDARGQETEEEAR